jgi:hypothetical protein
VDSAVDVAKESADIILLEKSLLALEEGIMEGVEDLFMEVGDRDKLISTPSSGFAGYEASAGLNGKGSK